MKKFDRIKTIQLILLMAITASSLVVILRNSELYALIATNMAAKTISILLWLTLGLSFLFLLYDFSSYADMRRENSELDNAVYSDALTGIANRYSVDAYIGQFLGKPLPEHIVKAVGDGLKSGAEVLAFFSQRHQSVSGIRRIRSALDVAGAREFGHEHGDCGFCAPDLAGQLAHAQGARLE